MKTFHLPDLGEGLAEAEIHEWYIKVGDEVKVDQPLVLMETAKAVVEVPSPRAGKIEKLFGKKGDIILTGAPLVEFEGEGESTRKDKGTVVGHLVESNHVLDEGEMMIGVAKSLSNTIVKAMPVVRVLARQLNVDLNLVTPTGPQGQITAEDVKKAANHKTIEKAEALHGVRRVMAMTMAQAHQEIVPVTIMDDADITDVLQGDVTVLLLQAIISAIATEPGLNAWYDGKTMELCKQNKVHMGIAMDTIQGLFVPVIKNANEKNAEELRTTIDSLKKSVRDRSVPPEELHGATITLSNFGMLAGRYASPIIVPPQVAILGCGRIRDEVRVYEKKMAIRRVAPLSLTFDHRVVTGGEASRFLGAVIKFLEKKKT